MNTRSIKVASSTSPHRRPLHTRGMRLALPTMASAIALSMGIGAAQAQVSGTYSIGDVSPFTNGTTALGGNSYSLTSSGTLAGPPSGFSASDVNFTPNITIVGGQLGGLAADFINDVGGAGGGAPRLVVSFANNQTLDSYLGTPPSFTDDAASLETYSGVNLINSTNDTGVGSSGFLQTFEQALIADGLQNVAITGVDFILDGAWSSSGPQSLQLNSIDLALKGPDSTETGPNGTDATGAGTGGNGGDVDQDNNTFGPDISQISTGGQGGDLNNGTGGGHAGNGGDGGSTGDNTGVNNGTFAGIGGKGGNVNSGTGTAGNGGAGSAGGDVSGDISFTFAGTGGAGGDVLFPATGNGGNGGPGTVGPSTLTGLAPTDPVTALAIATGGNGGQGSGLGFSGGDGGAGVIAGPIHGVSVSEATPGSGTVSVTATQIGGNGGTGVNNASGGFGADSTLTSEVANNTLIVGPPGNVDVNGFTTGELDLALNATGGNGGGGDGAGTSRAGANGSATLLNDQSLLPVGNQAAQLNGTATGTGGNGGAGTNGANGADGGVGSATTTMIGGNSGTALGVSATSNLIGGNGGNASDGGNAGNGASETNGLIPVILTNAQSTSTASVTVQSTTTAQGGNGGAASGTGAGNGGNGGDATLVDATIGHVGSGGGILELTQTSQAGNGGNSAAGTPGTGGNATSILDTTDGTATDLRVTIGATGGNGGSSGSGGFAPNTSNGGTALIGGITSGLGAVTVNGTAQAGNGGDARGLGNFAANGQDITVSNPSFTSTGLVTGDSTGGGPVSVTVTETAGNGGAGTNGAFAGDGGNSIISNAVGTITGGTTGTLTLNQTATAGNGGDADTQNGGNGGIAVSNLTQTSLLATTFNGTSTANGGNGGNGGSNAGIGGGAVATIDLTGNAVFATADANGGSGSGGGAAVATATGSGSSGLASANATTPGTGPVFQVQSHATGTIGSTTVAQGSTNIGGNVPSLQPAFAPGFTPNSFAFATGLPNAASVTTALVAHPNNTAVWTQPTSFVAGAGLQGAAFNGTIGVSHTYNTETDYNFSVPFGKGTLLTVGLLNGESFGTLSGVDNLTFQVTYNGVGVSPTSFSFLPAGVTVGANGVISFGSLAAADAFFSDDVLTFDPPVGTNTIGINLDLTAADAVGFQGNFLVGTTGAAGPGPAGVPEPGTLAIFLSAILGWFGIRYRQRKSDHGARMA